MPRLMQKLIKILMPYVYSRPYVYSFWQIFQALCLFPALRLFRTLEYLGQVSQLGQIQIYLIINFSHSSDHCGRNAFLQTYLFDSLIFGRSLFKL